MGYFLGYIYKVSVLGWFVVGVAEGDA